MIISAEEKKEGSVLSVVNDKPDYPHGLKLHLDPMVVRKLGIPEMPEVGKRVLIIAKAEVVSVNKDDSSMGDVDEFSVSLQIQDMEVQPEQKEARQSNMLYGDHS